MSVQTPKPGPPTVWDRVAPRSAAAEGYDLAANVLVGFGLGWLVQHFFTGIRPWGLVGGLVLGSVSGFYQLFKAQGRRSKATNMADTDKDGPGQ